jgi:hypothetical protein
MSESSPSNAAPQTLEEQLTKLQNLLRENQDVLMDGERSEHERVEQQWIREEIQKCDGVYKQLEKISREDSNTRKPANGQNAGVYEQVRGFLLLIASEMNTTFCYT